MNGLDRHVTRDRTSVTAYPGPPNDSFLSMEISWSSYAVHEIFKNDRGSTRIFFDETNLMRYFGEIGDLPVLPAVLLTKAMANSWKSWFLSFYQIRKYV
jgi:hypothetical protein